MSLSTIDAEVLALMLADRGEAVTVNGVAGRAVITDMGEAPAGTEWDQSRRTGRAILSKTAFTLTRIEERNYGTLIDAAGDTWTITEITGATAAHWQVALERITLNRTKSMRTR